jgi:hypothetical protein
MPKRDRFASAGKAVVMVNSLFKKLSGDIENHSISNNFYKKKLKTYFLQLNYEVDHIYKFRCNCVESVAPPAR